MCENDLKHVYTQYTQGAASNGSLSRDMAAEPALEACHRGTCHDAKGAMSDRHGHGRARGRPGMPAGGGPI